MKPLLSTIIVKYKSEKYLPDCLDSIGKNPKWETFVVDNDKENIGYGPACNQGATKAKGRYLLFLNPDTWVLPNSLEKMVEYMENHPGVGVLGPQLLKTKKGGVVPSSSAIPTPLMAVFAFSFLDKIWKNNPYSVRCWYRGWESNSIKEVGVVSGATLMIRKTLFKKLDGFDEKLFLFFEEVDLCKRAKEMSKKVVFFPKAKIVHYGGKSTPKTPRIGKIFRKSRFYFFKKHYGILPALFLEVFLEYLGIFVLFLIASFLRFFRIEENLVFHGELGENYLAVKNAIINRQIPLLGPPTSHPWLHFGPLFYYLLMPLFLLTNFHPATGAYLIAFFNSLVILLNYFVVREIFDKKTAIFSSFIIAFSSLWLEFTRGARFFCLVPFLIYPFLWFLFKVVKNKGEGLFCLGLTLGIILNFHYTPLILFPVIATVFWKEKVKPVKKQFLKGFLGFLLPNIPFLIYEISHRFEMSTKLLLWVPYRIVGFFGLYPKNTFSLEVLKENLKTFYQFFSLSFLPK